MEDYKEKYEKALERGCEFYIKLIDAQLKKEVEEIFPELKESKDERIRKSIIELVKQSSHILNPMNQKSMIEWLKKQGEHTNFRNKIQIGDEVTRNEDGALVNLSQLKRMVKQGEQKPVEWSAYDKATLEYIIEDIKELCDNETEEGSIETYNRELNLLQAINKSIKLSSYTNPAAWSEEDEKKIDLLIAILEVNHPNGQFKVNPINTLNMEAMSTKELVDWLKSLKDRVQPQPKQEWSEELELTGKSSR